MKVAIITDTHFVCRQDKLNVFYNVYERFYKEDFFPYIDKHKIDTVLHLGDIYDNRKSINPYAIDFSKRVFFDKLQERNIKVTSIIGNHDIYFKNKNDINSPELLLNEYDNVELISNQAKEITLGNSKILMVAWINDENKEDILHSIDKSEADICMGHFEIVGFEMFKGSVALHGFKPTMFNKFKKTFSGHFHHKSTLGNISYLGNPYQTTWSCSGDERGFHIFDTETHELEFVPNTKPTFVKVFVDSYDDSLDYSNTFVKVYVTDGVSDDEVRRITDEISEKKPFNIDVVFNKKQSEKVVIDMEEYNHKDFTGYAKDYVDNVDNGELDPDKIVQMINDLHQECEKGK